MEINPKTGFAVVYFVEEEIYSEVPAAWIVYENGSTLCYWPSRSVEKISSVISDAKAVPDDENFELHSVYVKGFYDDYTVARKKAADSSYETSDDDKYGKGKRRHIPRDMSFFKEFTDNENSPPPVPATLQEKALPIRHIKKEFVRKFKSKGELKETVAGQKKGFLTEHNSNSDTDIHANSFATSKVTDRNYNHEKKDPDVATRSTRVQMCTSKAQCATNVTVNAIVAQESILKSENESRPVLTPHGTSGHENGIALNISRPNSYENDDDADLLDAVFNLETQIGVLEGNISMYAVTCDTSVEYTSYGEIEKYLPLKSVEAVLDFDEVIGRDEDTKTQFRKFLMYEGGNTTTKATTNLLKVCFSPPCRRLISWIGSEEKLAFQDLRMKKIIIGVVKDVKGATDSEIVKIIQTWFKNSPRVKEALSIADRFPLNSASKVQEFENQFTLDEGTHEEMVTFLEPLTNASLQNSVNNILAALFTAKCATMYSSRGKAKYDLQSLTMLDTVVGFLEQVFGEEGEIRKCITNWFDARYEEGKGKAKRRRME